VLSRSPRASTTRPCSTEWTSASPSRRCASGCGSSTGSCGRPEGVGETVRILEYGAWPSPIDAATAAAHDGSPEFADFVGDEVWWTEPRPAEGGRRTLVRRHPDGREEAVLPAAWNVRSRVHEYGRRPRTGKNGRAHGCTTAPSHNALPLSAASDPAAPHDGSPGFADFVGAEVWWTEPRPAEGGRRTLVRRHPDGREEAVLPAPWNVRSRVHEYGGRPWTG